MPVTNISISARTPLHFRSLTTRQKRSRGSERFCRRRVGGGFVTDRPAATTALITVATEEKFGEIHPCDRATLVDRIELANLRTGGNSVIGGLVISRHDRAPRPRYCARS